MSKHEGPGFWTRFLSGKGFYIALALCLVAIGGVAVASFTAQPRLPAESEPSVQEPVDNPITGVPDDRTTTRATTTARTTSRYTLPPTTKPTTSTTAAPAELFVLPFGNTVSKAFSEDPVFSETMQDWRTHGGTDFSGEAGQVIRAMADGTVTDITEDLLWGSIITIDHGFGCRSRYCGAIPKGIAKGDRVKVGQTIAVLGTVPCESADAPHLHLEVISGGKSVDPVALIGLAVRNNG